MTITVVYSPQRANVNILRMLDMRRRSLVLMVGWHMTPTEILEQVRPQLTDAEAIEVAAAFGLDPPSPPSRPVTNSGP